MVNEMCRGCGDNNFETLLDLGLSPISNSLLSGTHDISSEAKHPLCVVVCLSCGFCQLSEDSEPTVHFHSEYVYFSSFSKSWLEHCSNYADRMINELQLTQKDLVVELASNDGYLLKNFKNSGVQVLGIEPSANVAEAAERAQIPTIVKFFGSEIAKKMTVDHAKPRLIIGNNVLAHVPNIRDFVHGISILLADNGIVTLEFPHLVQLISNHQFDTIYHEHYSYLSLTALQPIFEEFDLKVFRIETISTHGGSIRVFASKSSNNLTIESSVNETLIEEKEYDPRNQQVRSEFSNGTRRIIDDFRQEIEKLICEGKTVVAFGAAAKGNTLLNAAGISKEQIKFIVDTNPAKQQKLAPGSHIPIISVDEFNKSLFDVCVILPWNISAEISQIIRNSHGESVKLLRAIPELEYI
jgi:hypothetical protein